MKSRKTKQTNKNSRLIFLATIFILVTIAFINVLAVQPPSADKVKTFTDCMKKGYIIVESFPRQCRTPDGAIFTEELSQQMQKDLESVPVNGIRTPLE